MTVPNSPIYSMNLKAGNQLLEEINKAVQTVQASMAKKRQNPPRKHPHALPKAKQQNPADNPFGGAIGGDMSGLMLGNMLLDFLFGMPMLSMLGEASRGLAQVGMMDMMENDRMRREKNRRLDEQNAAYAMLPPASTSFDDVVAANERMAFIQALASEKNRMRQMVLLRQLMMTLLAQMMQQAQDSGDKDSGSGDAMLVADVLRDPKMARFKQNRQSISCIRTLFVRQSSIVAPSNNNFPRYNVA